jgi:O-antigen/teichoic acid export membrane protein
MRGRLLRSRAGGAYVTSRFVAAGASLVLAAAVTRVLSSEDVGRFAVAIAIASFAGIYFASSVRRLVMYRSDTADLSDLKISAAIGGVVGVAVAAATCAVLFDATTAVLAGLLAGQRGADGYAEIGQGAWCNRGEFSRAARALTFRTAGSTLVAVGVLVVVPNPVLALTVGLIVRTVLAWAETHSARPQQFTHPRGWDVLRSFRVGAWVAVPSAAILLVEAGPTIGVAEYAGFDTASLLTPLGRIRFAVILIATTLAELAYPGMVRLASRHEPIARAAARPAAQFVASTVVLAPFILLASPLFFGSKLDGEYVLIFLAVLSGATMGLCNIMSLGLTARARIGPQVATYSAAAAVATLGAWATDWTLTGLFVSQSLACALAFGVFVLLALSRDRGPLDNPDLTHDAPAATF